MTLLITQSNPDVKRAAVAAKPFNVSIKGPYSAKDGNEEYLIIEREFGGSVIHMNETSDAKIVKVTLNPGDLLNRISNVYLYSGDNTLVSVTGYPGLKPTKRYSKFFSQGSSQKIYLYSPFPFGSGSKKITKKTTLTFTFKKATNLIAPVIVGPKTTSSGGFFWYGSDKTVMIGPTNRNLTSLTIPGTTKIISSNAFNACTNLTGNLVIPNSVTYIGSFAFQDCSKLAGSLTIKNTNIKLGSLVFSGNGGLTGNISLYRSNTTVNSVNGLNNVTVKYLGEN